LNNLSCPTKHHSNLNIPNNLNQADNLRNHLPSKRTSNPEAQNKTHQKVFSSHNLSLELSPREMVSHNKITGAGRHFDHDISIGRDNRRQEDNNPKQRTRMLRKNELRLPGNQANRSRRDLSRAIRSNNEGDNNRPGWTSVSSFLCIMKRSR
jgi:hypothetical protein